MASMAGTVGSPVGLTIEPLIQTMYNLTGDTLVEGDVVVLDLFGESAGASYSAAYGSPTHPLSRVVDISQVSATLVTQQNIGQCMVYIGKVDLPAGGKGLFMVNGKPTRVKTFAAAGENALFAPNPPIFGIPQTANITDKQVEPIQSANDRLLFFADSVGANDAVAYLSGLWRGDFGIGFGRVHT